MKYLAPVLVAFLLGSCSGDTSNIEKFAGDWETPPMSEWLEIGIVEQLEDLRDGTHPGIEGFEESEIEEILSLPIEEAKPRLMESSKSPMLSKLFEQADPRIGFTISPPSKLIAYLAVNGERQSVEYDAEYELTSKEIICRYEGGPTILTISGDHLIVINENGDAYPKYFKLTRVSHSPNTY